MADAEGSDPKATGETILEIGSGTGATPPPPAPPPPGGPPPPAPPDSAGDGRPRLGPYVLLEELGRGGMGAVYRAHRTDLKRDYALKVILPGQDASAEVVERFKREAQAAAGLAGHPGIVGVHDIGEDGGKHYFAMELIDGKSLEDLIGAAPASDAASLTPPRAAEIVERAAEAVHFAHTRGVLHRDLKPANIMVDGAGTPWVADFGLASTREADAASARLTKSGAVLGTPAYMPPEQAKGDGLDVRADVYALGATLYEALVGEPPFVGETVYSVLAHVMKDEPRPAAKRNPFVPRDLDTIVLKCLEKDRDRRYATAQDLADDLRRYRLREAITARPASFLDRLRRRVRRNPAPWTVGAIAVAVVLGLVGNFWFRALKAESRKRARAAEFRTQAEAAEQQQQWQAAAFLWVRSAAILGATTPAGRDAQSRAGAAQAAAERAALIASVARLMEIGQSQQAFHAQFLDRLRGLEDAERDRRLTEGTVDEPAEAALAEGRRALEGAYTAAVAALQGARAVLADVPDAAEHRTALQGLAAMAWHRLEHAEATGRTADARRFLHDLQAFEDALAGVGAPAYAERLRGDGTLTLDTVPSGAAVECRRYRPGPGGRLEDLPYDPHARAFASAPVTLGTTPLRDVLMPMGSYVLILRSPGKRDTRYPVWIERGEHESLRAPIPLYTDAEIGPDFVYVPAGETVLGADQRAVRSFPRHKRWIDGFFVCRHEVTMSEYRDFLDDQMRTGALTPEQAHRMVPRTARQAGHYWRIRNGRVDFNEQWTPFPVMAISWHDAVAYCRWRSAHDGRAVGLPSEREWARAARGADTRPYVFGRTFNWGWLVGSNSPFHRKGSIQPKRVYTAEYDVSPFGVRDLGGSVMEMCSDALLGDPTQRLRRGGGWSAGDPLDFRIGARYSSMAVNVLNGAGFRVRASARAR